jgi:hypothetical protein
MCLRHHTTSIVNGQPIRLSKPFVQIWYLDKYIIHVSFISHRLLIVANSVTNACLSRIAVHREDPGACPSLRWDCICKRHFADLWALDSLVRRDALPEISGWCFLAWIRISQSPSTACHSHSHNQRVSSCSVRFACSSGRTDWTDYIPIRVTSSLRAAFKFTMIITHDSQSTSSINNISSYPFLCIMEVFFRKFESAEPAQHTPVHFRS